MVYSPRVHHADSQTGGNISLVPLPKIDEMYSRLKGAKLLHPFRFMKWVLSHWSIRRFKSQNSLHYPFGKYQFEVVPFGLAQAPAYFQQLISMVLQDCSKFMMAYLDDIIIFSRNEREHLKHIKNYFSEINWCRSKAEGVQMWFLQERNPLLGTPNFFRGNPPSPREIRHHTQHA